MTGPDPLDAREPGGPAGVAARASGGSPAEIAGLLDRASEFAQGSRAASTWAAYERDWARFIRWCASRGLAAMPAAAETVCAWLADQAPTWRAATADDPLETVVEGQVRIGEGLRPATIARRLAAVSVAHQTAAAARGQQVPNPAEDPAVRAVMTGIRRHPGVGPPRRRTAARSEAVNTMIAGLDPHHDPVDARDLALILVAYGSGLRRSDLERLDLEDLSTDAHGLAVRIRRSKTDQAGHGTVRGIAPQDDGHCPAAEAVECWRAHLSRAGVTRGALWRPIHRARSGRLTIRPMRLSGESIDAVVTRRAAQVGLEGNYGSHSLRRGLATEALAAGHAEHVVMRHGRWRSRAAMDPYIDDAETFAATNPTRGLGLRPITRGDPGTPEDPEDSDESAGPAGGAGTD